MVTVVSQELKMSLMRLLCQNAGGEFRTTILLLLLTVLYLEYVDSSFLTQRFAIYIRVFVISLIPCAALLFLLMFSLHILL